MSDPKAPDRVSPAPSPAPVAPANGRILHPIPGAGGEVYVSFAATPAPTRDAGKGRAATAETPPAPLPADAGPSEEQVAEATHYVKTLEQTGQLSHEPGPLPPGATHRVESDEQGRKLLVRKRFSAI